MVVISSMVVVKATMMTKVVMEVVLVAAMMAEIAVAEVVMVTTMVRLMVDGLVVTHFDGYLNFLYHLERDCLGLVNGYLDSLNVLDGFGDGDMLNDGDFDRNFDGVRL